MTQNRRTFLRAIGAGSVGMAGAGLFSTSAAAATIITIRGGGADIWNREDAFHFYYDKVNGDFDVEVEVVALEEIEPFTKTGLMVRESLEPDAANVMLRWLPNGEAQLQWRPKAGADSVSTTSGAEDESEVDGGGIEVDFVRLRRDGDTIEAYGSNDGEDWTLIADLEAAVDLSSDALVGIPLTSHVEGTLCTAELRDLEGVSPTNSVDVGDVGVDGSVSVEEGVPLVSTGEATDVTATSATLHGELTDLGEADSSDCYFEYREVPTESWTATDARTLAEPGSFEIDLSGLTSRRYYEVRAVADTSDGDTAIGSAVTVGTPSRSDGEDGSEGPSSPSAFDPGDGFAEPAPWLDNDTPVIKITEPTRRQLEAATRVEGPRLVVFETSGTIDLNAQRLTVTNGQLYLAGQTAPSPGITLIRGGLWLSADDCVVQHVRVRPGDAGQDTGWEPDAIQTGDGTQNNVIDHCTGTWGIDENINAGYDTVDTTISNCLVAEPLNDATHSKGEHGYNSIIGDRATNVTYAGNVLAYATDRNPRLKQGTETVVANNLIHRYEDGMWADPETAHSIEGNVFQWPVSEQANVFGEGSVHADANVLDWDADVPMIGDGITLLDERPLWPDGLDRIATDRVQTHNLTNVGARPADRTDHDERIVENVRTAGGSVIDSQDEVGGYPDLAENTRSLAVPSNGTRAWLRRWARRVEARIAYQQPSATEVTVGERLTFDVEDASGDDRWIDSLEWEFGDGETASGWWTEHRYDEPGTYTVELTATDNTGHSTTDTVTIEIS